MTKRRKSGSAPVLVAVDFSSHSAAALRWAAEAAACRRVPLVVLHVVHDPGSAPGYYSGAGKTRHLQRLEEAAVEMMRTFLREQRDEIAAAGIETPFEEMLAVGLPVTRILEVAETIDAQLIVMGSQGRTGLPHLLLGSKAERVAQLAPVAVTIVKAPKPRGRSSRGKKR